MRQPGFIDTEFRPLVARLARRARIPGGVELGVDIDAGVGQADAGDLSSQPWTHLSCNR